MKTKNAIFLSHSSADVLAATAFANYVRGVFGCDVFLSEEIPKGEKWRDKILEALAGCKAVIVLATPNSIERLWVNFEIGAAYALKKPLIPLCAGGLSPGSLPDTLNDRQAGIRENRLMVKRSTSYFSNYQEAEYAFIWKTCAKVWQRQTKPYADKVIREVIRVASQLLTIEFSNFAISRCNVGMGGSLSGPKGAKSNVAC